jgi:hypothetical protein
MKTIPYMKPFFNLLLIFTIINGFAQTDWEEELTENVVTVENGKYSVVKYMLYSVENGSSMQVKTSAVAPIGVISRDKFVAFYSTYTTIAMLTAILTQVGIDHLYDLKSKELDELIGQPDLSIHLEMTKAGFQLQLTVDGETMRETMTWEDFYEED